jgi:hypothetical protein
LPLVIFGAFGITVLKFSSVIHFPRELQKGAEPAFPPLELASSEE